MAKLDELVTASNKLSKLGRFAEANGMLHNIAASLAESGIPMSDAMSSEKEFSK